MVSFILTLSKKNPGNRSDISVGFADFFKEEKISSNGKMIQIADCLKKSGN